MIKNNRTQTGDDPMQYGLLSLCAASVLALAAPTFAQEIKPIPQTVKVNADKVALGERLYHDKQLSADGTLSCASCHMLHKGGADGREVSLGVKGQKGGVNSPSVFNSAHNFVQFWDGRAKDLKAQAAGPVANPSEMGETWANVEKKIAADASYADAFKKSYGGKVTQANITDAIAEFEKSLITPDSRFDKFLRGDKAALNATEQKGYALFQEKGCTSCHSGDYLGGESFQMLNPDYFKDRGGKLTDGDMGRYNVTKQEEDKHNFKVPMLRNVALTAPYFHDGKVKTLDDAVRKMAKYQLGEDLQPSEVQAIVAFLKSTTGTYKGTPLDKLKAQ
jgi:cytochrome c peroxidase